MRSSVAVAVLCLAAAGAPAGELIERVAAVVDGRALFLSDVRAVEMLDGLDRAAALARLVDETLLFHEAFRLPQAAPGAAGGVTEEGDEAVRRARHRRAVIRQYVDFRFRPQVRIEDDAVRRAYEEDVAQEPDEAGFAAAAPRIRERLTNAEVDRRVAEWVRDLRAAASVRYNPPDGQ